MRILFALFSVFALGFSLNASRADESPISLVEAVIPDEATFMKIVMAAQKGEGDLTRYMTTAKTTDAISFDREFSYGRCGRKLRKQAEDKLKDKSILREAQKLLADYPGTLEIELDYMNDSKPYFFEGFPEQGSADRKGVVHRVPSPDFDGGCTGEFYRATLTYTYESRGATGKFDLNSVIPIDPLQIHYVKLTDRQETIEPQNEFTIGLHFIGPENTCYLNLDRSISHEIKSIAKKLAKQAKGQK